MGAPASLYLAGLGIGKLGIVDGDQLNYIFVIIEWNYPIYIDRSFIPPNVSGSIKLDQPNNPLKNLII